MAVKVLHNPLSFLDKNDIIDEMKRRHDRVMRVGRHTERHRAVVDDLRVRLATAHVGVHRRLREMEEPVEGYSDDISEWLTEADFAEAAKTGGELAPEVRSILSQMVIAKLSARFGFRRNNGSFMTAISTRAERIAAAAALGGKKKDVDPGIRRLALAQVAGHVRETVIPDPDAAAARLHAEFPWMSVANIGFMQDARRPGPFRLRPIILAGEPGNGKSSWSSAVAAAAGMVPVRIDLAASGGGFFEIAGMEAGWSGSSPGRVVQGIAQLGVKNPVVIIEEVDLAVGSATTSNGRSFPGAVYALMSMIEPETAKAWRCPSSSAVLDLRGVSWIMTTNRLHLLPQPLIDRVQVINIPNLTHDQIRTAAWRAGEGLQEGFGDVLVEAVDERRRRGAPVRTLRGVRKMIEHAETLLEAPRLN